MSFLKQNKSNMKISNHSNLTAEQKKKLRILESKLKKAVLNANYLYAKELVIDIQTIIRKVQGQETRLMKSKNWLFQAAMEAGEICIAEMGLIGVLKKTNKNTRVHIEATALLAIVYLRQNDFKKAEPLISEVLRNDKVIKSDTRRRQFRLNTIKRFEEEITIASFKNKFNEKISAQEIQDEAGKLVQEKTDDDIYELIGKSSPPETRELILKVNEYAKKQLPPSDIKLLPSAVERINDKNIGITVFEATKNVIWRSLCDPKSDIYKAWVEKGIGFFFSRIYLGSAIASALANLGMGIMALAVPITALVIKAGIEVYCIRYKPKGIMIE